MSSKSITVLTALVVLLLGGAALSGPPGPPTADVNVVNEPGVYILDLPDVNVANTPDVNVTNTVTVQSVAKEPVFFRFNFLDNATSNFLPWEDHYIVPEGKRLTVTHVSGTAHTPSLDFTTLVSIYTKPTMDSYRLFHQLVPSPGVDDANVGLRSSSYSQAMEFVALSGEGIGFQINRTTNDPNNGHYFMSVSGYLEPEP